MAASPERPPQAALPYIPLKYRRWLPNSFVICHQPEPHRHVQNPFGFSRTENSRVLKRKGGRWSISAYRTRHTFSPQHSLSKQGKNCLLFSKARLSLMSYLFPWNFPSQNLGMQSTPFLTPPNSALLRK